MAAIESNSGIEVREDERLRERERSREEATVCTACSSSGASDSVAVSAAALVRLLVLRCCPDIAAMDLSFEFQIFRQRLVEFFVAQSGPINSKSI